MNSKVHVACPMCGPIDVDGASIAVSRRLDAIDTVYRFECTECSETITRHASPSEFVELLRAGAHVEPRPSPTTDGLVIVLSNDVELPTDAKS